MPAAIKPFLFFIKLPDLGKLVTVHMNINLLNESSHRSLFHLQILKCRELIFMQTTCLATPVKFSTSHITAVVSIPTFKSIEFKECLKKLDLEIVEIKETTPTALQECLQYTCTVKLSPDWNILQDFLVEGQRFLTDNSALKSVKMDIFVSNKEISLCLLPSCIKFPPLRMDYYATDEQLATSSIIPLDEKCIVFPSLKTAHLLSISRSPKLFGTFKTYLEFQEHWKNMYGYILPTVPEQKSIWYFNVTFRVPNATCYTYPQFCVRSQGPTVIPRVDPRPILATFIKAFCKKVTNICGDKCRIIEGKASFPELGLFLAEDISEDMRPRPGSTYAMKPNVPYRKDLPQTNAVSNKNVQFGNSNKNAEKENLNSAGNNALVSKNILTEGANNNTDLNLPLSSSGKGLSQATKGHGSSGNIPGIHSTAIKSMTSDVPQTPTANSAVVPPVKYAPCFYPRKPKTMQKNLETEKKIVYAPKFPPKKSTGPTVKKQIQGSSLSCKTPSLDHTLKSTTSSSVSDPVPVNTILNCFNVKKKTHEEKKSAQACIKTTSGKKQTIGTGSNAAKKMKKA